MTIARRQLIDVSVSRWYHCVTRCVRRAFLLGEGLLNRKQWVEDRIKELAELFAVGIGGFSVMDNHLHLLLRLNPEVAAGWSDEEVVLRTRQPSSKRPRKAACRVRVRQAVWRRRCGFARSRIDASWTHRARACSRGCRSAITSSWSTIRPVLNSTRAPAARFGGVAQPRGLAPGANRR